MRKLVVLKLDGDLLSGVRATLEIGSEGAHLTTQVACSLPAIPQMVNAIDEWYSLYGSNGELNRIKVNKIVYGSLSENRKNCQKKACELRNYLNQWLLSESFRPIREKWLKYLMPSDEIRVLINTNNLQLKKLPWHLWDLVDRDYPKAEITLSAYNSDRIDIPQTSISGRKVKILAILGNSDGIDVGQDRQLLENLKNADTTFLVQPRRQDINEQLWNQNWNILFFAGHTQTEENTGRIYINQEDSLTIAELRYALRNAARNGLQLAIFNSCDGLGLVAELQDLHIGQIIVMKEAVPDFVAQQFLKYFLTTFSTGESIYIAVRTAREKLQGLEAEYPGASWLPIICEHPTIKPMQWKQSVGSPRNSLKTMVLASMLITSFILGIRELGFLQKWELQAYDFLMRSRPDEGPSERLLVVGIRETDFQLPEQKDRKGSLADSALHKLLLKLEPHQPRVIGLDIFRDFPVNSAQKKLKSKLLNSDRFFAICHVGEPSGDYTGIAPPPEIPEERLGFSNVLLDDDGVLRRYILSMDVPVGSNCPTTWSFGFQLALHYLKDEKIQPEFRQGNWHLGDVVFSRLSQHSGGYQKADTWGNQILLNYRSYRSPNQITNIVSLKDVLGGKVTPEQIKDKIIIIGVMTSTSSDHFRTPYSDKLPISEQYTPGAIVHAQAVSQILNAVLDKRPLLSPISLWLEILWIGFWACCGGILVLQIHSLRLLVGATFITIFVMYGVGFFVFINGVWLPIIPSKLALLSTTGFLVIIYKYKPQL
ncbi:putative transmembrane sensor domain protein [Rivularia sp. PCC 7116]|uniref:CHASE2 domain-containing protein n=1 Tax=Rivularia sp. PCC 7116 TaxID=373994 RepID=UPI00029F4017|nr:CHASE2 domain-containing protein [Rivularia sp. PCC 7116]AFY58017.1 putative transmembrane sensor domain protein [Rivularia sp. PCC 7116]